MKKVFISYSSAEYEEASKYRKMFTEKGINCWMAPESIPVGSNYAIEIPKAIQDADVFVLILSENSQNSKWVRKEIDLAVNLNKAIFPVRLNNGQLISPFSFYLADVQMTQATDDTEIVAERLLAVLDPNNAKSGFEAVSVSDNTTNNGNTYIPAPATGTETQKNSSGKLRTKIPFIAAGAVAVVGIGVGVGIALSAGGNAPATGSGIVSEAESVSSAEDVTDIIIGDIRQVTELECTLSFGMNNTIAGTFTGEAADGKTPHGTGKFVCTDNDGVTSSYEGSFANGKPEGEMKCTSTYPKGHEYKDSTCTGIYKNGLAEGKFITEYVYTDGTVQVNESLFVNGVENGKSKRTYTSSNGSVTVYEESWTNGKMTGQGTVTTTYGDENSDAVSMYYEGEFKNDKCNGFGRQTITYTEDDDRISSVYEGEWQDGKQHGKGTETITYHSGMITVYECNYDNGEKTGFGTRKTTYPEGGKLKTYYYEGEWSKSKADGKGKQVYEYTSGETAVFECSYADGRITGFGTHTITYPEGHERKSYHYEGEWELDKRNGQGKMTITYSDGNVEIKEGQWKDGEFIG